MEELSSDSSMGTESTSDSSSKILQRLGACQEAIQWVGNRTPRQAWDECERADWLLWIAAKMKGNNTRQQIVLAACDCARLALRFVPAGELRPLQAIEAAERWANDPTEKNREIARAAAAAASAAAAYASDAYAYDAAAKTSEHLKMCKLVRKRLTVPVGSEA
jgi:hypothetical protein